MSNKTEKIIRLTASYLDSSHCSSGRYLSASMGHWFFF